jgi:hypothetical protein
MYDPLHTQQFLNIALSDKVLNYVTTLFGASAMYVFSLFRGFAGSVPALKKLFPAHTDVFYDRWDFVILVLTGSIVGTIFFHPQDTLQALSAGFGWTGAINVLVSQKPPDTGAALVAHKPPDPTPARGGG